MIPKIIHYAWVGDSIPDDVRLRIKEWEEVLPDWTFMFWNEKNWDFEKDKYSKQQLFNKNYGFAIDVLRYEVVYRYGGFYLDTDMILKQPLDQFLKYDNVFGFFNKNSITTSFFGAKKESDFILNLYKIYTDSSFQPLLYRAAFEGYTSNPIITNYFVNNIEGIQLNNKNQILLDGQLNLYSKETFTYQSFSKKKTFSIHLLENSWNHSSKLNRTLKKYFIKLFGLTIWGKISAVRGARREEYRMLDDE